MTDYLLTQHATTDHMYIEVAALLCLGWFAFIFLVCGIGYVQLLVKTPSTNTTRV